LTVTEAEIIRGDWFDWTAGEVPLRECAAMWIVERAGLAPRTVGLHQPLLRLHIAPRLGDLDLVAITPGLVRSWRNDLLDRGVGRPTVAKCYRLLRAVVNTAVDDELVRRNPCRIKGAGSEPGPRWRRPSRCWRRPRRCRSVGRRSFCLARLRVCAGASCWR
jgi:hypothetical protein